MKLNLALNIMMGSLITKSVVYGQEKALKTRSLTTMEEVVGAGCRNSIIFYGHTKTKDGSKCVKSTLCEASHTNDMFIPQARDTCVQFSDDEPECSLFEVVTSFEEGWSLQHLTMKPSKMDASLDPKSVTFLASNDKLVWKELLSSEVAFQNREDKIEYAFKNEETYYHYALQYEKSKETMHVGKVGLVESYTASCTADLYHKITGVSIPYYETMAPTSVPSISPTKKPFQDVPPDIPSNVPSDILSNVPSDMPSNVPSDMPSNVASDMPSNVPSDMPSDVPSYIPSNVPSDMPSNVPSDMPSNVPSDMPSDMPSNVPSDISSNVLSDIPSNVPSDIPSTVPSDVPSNVPSDVPSDVASDMPSNFPSDVPCTIDTCDNPFGSAMNGWCALSNGSDNGYENSYHTLGTYASKNDCLSSCYDYFISSSGEYLSGCEHEHSSNNNNCHIYYLKRYIVTQGDGGGGATCWVIDALTVKTSPA